QAIKKSVLREKNILYGFATFAVTATPLLIYHQFASVDIDDKGLWLFVNRIRSSFHLFPDTWSYYDLRWPAILLALGFLSYMLFDIRREERPTKTQLFSGVALLTGVYVVAMKLPFSGRPIVEPFTWFAPIALGSYAIARPRRTSRTDYVTKSFFLAFGIL